MGWMCMDTQLRLNLMAYQCSQLASMGLTYHTSIDHISGYSLLDRE